MRRVRIEANINGKVMLTKLYKAAWGRIHKITYEIVKEVKSKLYITISQTFKTQQ